jgi:hypothetical protein
MESASQLKQLNRWLKRLLVLLVLGLLTQPAPAEAGIFQTLFGQRRARGQAANSSQGAGLRRGWQQLGGIDGAVPYLLTLRNTYELDDVFEIAWNPVPGARQYTVRLWRWSDAHGDRDWSLWETTTTATTLAYSGEIPLSPPRFYAIEVIADLGDRQVSSDRDAGCTALGFTLLFEENRALLEAELSQVDSVRLSAAEAALARADIYRRYGLLDDAIAALRAVEAENSTTLNLALGELYDAAALTPLALGHYQAALTLAPPSDFLSQALALEGIGNIATALALQQQNWSDASAELDPAALRVDSALNLGQAIAILQAAEQRFEQADAPLAGTAVGYRRASLALLQAQQQRAQADGLPPIDGGLCGPSFELPSELPLEP